jgi:hypothetical protein
LENPTEPICVSWSQACLAGETCAQAFHDMPIFVELIPDAAIRRRALKHIFTFYIRYGVLYGQVYATSSRFEGIGLLLPSNRVKMTVWRELRCGAISLLFNVDKGILKRLRFYDHEISKVHHRLTRSPHWYMAFIAVSPEFQASGHARTLMETWLAKVDAFPMPCYLETHIEAILPILRRYGFEIVEEFIIPGIGVTLWAMRRDPSL